MPDTSNVHRQVRDLKRKHQEEAVLRDEGEEGASAIFWSKKIQHDITNDKMVRIHDELLRREREVELERVRARRCLSQTSTAVRCVTHVACCDCPERCMLDELYAEARAHPTASRMLEEGASSYPWDTQELFHPHDTEDEHTGNHVDLSIRSDCMLW